MPREDVALPAGGIYALAWRVEYWRTIRKVFVSCCLVALSSLLLCAAYPVGAIWSIQDALLDHFAAHASPALQQHKTADFRSIHDATGVWEWMGAVVWPTILPKGKNSFPSAAQDDGRRAVYIRRYNRMMRTVRLRQLRVVQQPCTGNVRKAGGSVQADGCWPEFSLGVQSSELLRERYSWSHAEALANFTERNALSTPALDNAGGGGPVFVMGEPLNAQTIDLDCRLHDASLCSDLPGLLRRHAWIDEATRVVSMELNFYNANYDISTYLRLQFDFAASGRVRPTLEIHSLRLRPYSSKEDWYLFRRLAEIMFAFLVLLNFFIEILSLSCSGRACRYLRSPGRLVQLLFLALYVASIACWILFLTESKAGLGEDSGEFVDLLPLMRLFNKVVYLSGANCVLGGLLALRALKLHMQFSVLAETFREVAAQAVPCLALIFVIFEGFAFAGHWLFSEHVPEFGELGLSHESLLRMLLGDLDILPAASRTPLAAYFNVYFLLWTLVLPFVLFGSAVASFVEAHTVARRKAWYLAEWCRCNRIDLTFAEKMSAGDHFLFAGWQWRRSCCSPPSIKPNGSMPSVRAGRDGRSILGRLDFGLLSDWMARQIDAAVLANPHHSANKSANMPIDPPQPMLRFEDLVALFPGRRSDAENIASHLCEWYDTLVDEVRAGPQAFSGDSDCFSLLEALQDDEAVAHDPLAFVSTEAVSMVRSELAELSADVCALVDQLKGIGVQGADPERSDGNSPIRLSAKLSSLGVAPSIGTNGAP